MADDFKIQMDASVDLTKFEAQLSEMEKKAKATGDKVEKVIGGQGGNAPAGGAGGGSKTGLSGVAGSLSNIVIAAQAAIEALALTAKAIEIMGQAANFISMRGAGGSDIQRAKTGLAYDDTINSITGGIYGKLLGGTRSMNRLIYGANEENEDPEAALAAKMSNQQSRKEADLMQSKGWRGRSQAIKWQDYEQNQAVADMRNSGASEEDVMKAQKLSDFKTAWRTRDMSFDIGQEKRSMGGSLMSQRLQNAGQGGASQLVEIQTTFKNAILDAQRDTSDAGKAKVSTLQSLQRESLLGSMIANRGAGEEASLNTVALGSGAARLNGYNGSTVEGSGEVLKEILTAIQEGNRNPPSVGR